LGELRIKERRNIASPGGQEGSEGKGVCLQRKDLLKQGLKQKRGKNL